jgi:hypothetical protein
MRLFTRIMVTIGVLLAAALFPFVEAQNQTCVSWPTLQCMRDANLVGVVYDSFPWSFERPDPLSGPE